MLQLPQNNPSWMSANMALRELYDSQESITLRSVNEGAMQIPASGPGGLSSKVKVLTPWLKAGFRFLSGSIKKSAVLRYCMQISN